MPEQQRKTRVVPQLTKDIQALNRLKKKRAKVEELDAEIAELSEKIAAQLGVGHGQESREQQSYADAA